jgi:hypothetical protein
MLLTPIDKVMLARAHKVAKWLKEGVNELIEETLIQSLDQLQTLRLDTACRLLWALGSEPTSPPETAHHTSKTVNKVT